jgi:hypothetical protein
MSFDMGCGNAGTGTRVLHEKCITPGTARALGGIVHGTDERLNCAVRGDRNKFSENPSVTEDRTLRQEEPESGRDRIPW